MTCAMLAPATGTHMCTCRAIRAFLTPAGARRSTAAMRPGPGGCSGSPHEQGFRVAARPAPGCPHDGAGAGVGLTSAPVDADARAGLVLRGRARLPEHGGDARHPFPRSGVIIIVAWRRPRSAQRGGRGSRAQGGGKHSQCLPARRGQQHCLRPGATPSSSIPAVCAIGAPIFLRPCVLDAPLPLNLRPFGRPSSRPGAGRRHHLDRGRAAGHPSARGCGGA
jgi:hypothetical protein